MRLKPTLNLFLKISRTIVVHNRKEALFRVRAIYARMPMKKYAILILAITSLQVTKVSASAITEVRDWAWMGSLSVGPVWADAGRTQSFYLAPDIEKTYAANQSSNALVSGEFFAGIQKILPYQMLGQFGLAVAATSDADLQGTIWDDANPEFANYHYQYKVQTTRLVAKGKLLFDIAYGVMPWISASLGVSFNYAHSFTNSPLIFEALPNPNFSNNTHTAFTYTLGVGIQKALNCHWQVGVGYEFADWGQSQLGRASGQTLNTGLTLNHLYTNGILFDLAYLV